MHIFLYTPFYNYSTIVPHLVEHCIGVGHSTELGLFFQYSEVDSTQFPIYADIFIPDSVSLDGFLEILQKPLSRKIYLFEKSVLRSELSQSPYKQRLFEKIIRLFFHSGFFHSSMKRINFSDVSTYHEKYYQKGRIVVADDSLSNFRSVGFDSKKILDPGIFTAPKKLGTVRFGGFYNEIFQFENTPEGLFSAAIIESFISQYYLWKQRFQEGSHSVDSPYLFLSEYGPLLAIPKETLPLDIPENFIHNFICWYSQKGAWKELILSTLFFGNTCDKEKFILFISRIPFSSFSFLFSK